MTDADPEKDVAAIVREVVALALAESKTAKPETTKLVQAAAERRVLEGHEIRTGLQGQFRVETYTSMLPPPEILAHHEHQMPGLRAKIVEDWQTQRAHDREVERTKLVNDREAAKERTGVEWGRLGSGVVVVLAALVVLCVVAVHGQAVPTALVSALDALALGGWALLRRRGEHGGGQQ